MSLMEIKAMLMIKQQFLHIKSIFATDCIISFSVNIFENYASSPEISVNMYQILQVWFGRPILFTFLVIFFGF